MSVPTRQELKDSIMDENVLLLYNFNVCMKFTIILYNLSSLCSHIQLYFIAICPLRSPVDLYGRANIIMTGQSDFLSHYKTFVVPVVYAFRCL